MIFCRNTELGRYGQNIPKISIHLGRYGQNISFTNISADILKISAEMDCDGVMVKNPNFLLLFPYYPIFFFSPLISLEQPRLYSSFSYIFQIPKLFLGEIILFSKRKST